MYKRQYLDGDADARIECDDEGTIYRLFHSVNSMAAVLNAHATKEMRQKEFLKNTISDISHQLKTPLAALNIYNGLLLEETENMPEIKEFASLSEHDVYKRQLYGGLCMRNDSHVKLGSFCNRENHRIFIIC